MKASVMISLRNVNLTIVLTLSPSSLEEAEANAGLVQSLANKITALRRDMVVLLAKDLLICQHRIASWYISEAYHNQFTLDILGSGQRVIVLTLTKGF